MIKCDVVVIGGGAAGLMCAIEAGKRGRDVLVIERNQDVGKKILISGGGRCNFTNLHTAPENYLSANPHFCKSALARYTPWDFVALVEEHGIAYHEKELGQLFCDQSARQIVLLLLAECQLATVRIETDCSVTSLDATPDGFALSTTLGPVRAESVVVATGGLSIPKLGSSGFGYELARQFGHTIVPTSAGLVPFTLGEGDLARYADLSGIALPVDAACNEGFFSAGMLFTHRGLSGPAILQVSSYWQPTDTVTVNLLPGVDLTAWLMGKQTERPNAELRATLSDLLPRRLAQCLCDAVLPNRHLRQYTEAELHGIADQLQHWRFHPIGTEGYRTAEVTLGGVNTAELSSTTMASKKTPGLYFVGEVVDVTGHLGGYNFQWAWASGFAAGQAV